MKHKSLNRREQIHLAAAIATGGFFLLVDQGLKYIARHNQTLDIPFIGNWLAWDFFANPGIAFNLPVANALLLIITPIITILLIALLWRTRNSPQSHWMIIILLSGAFSNYIDRFLFGYTVDYLRIGTAVINLADILIIIGAAGLVLFHKKPSQQTNVTAL